jgi:hypothetical protein
LFFFKIIKILRKAGIGIAKKQKVSLFKTLIYKKKPPKNKLDGLWNYI